MFTKYPKLKKFLQIFKKKELEKKYPPFLDHLFTKIDSHIWEWGRVLIITLTKRSAEEITNFFIQKWYKTFYLHSEVATLKRREIVKKLRTGQIDILVWINLLREWLDLPEVSLIAILDADKEWFLRSNTALVQIIWRAARNPKWEVILYGDKFTPAILESLSETYRRRELQEKYNTKYWIIPTQAIWNAKNLETVKTDNDLDLKQDFNSLIKWKNKRLKRMTKKEKEIILKDLKWQLDECIKKRDFENAAVVRDQIKELTGD